ncbi:alkaline phosphatase family protein [Arthrobacter sp. 35W]|uniref:alkaline phosphatase family protein n=1 Tax=Arthrobacter sp. 35W TaxID=1132441 RepID=UPI001E46D340|nr:alkaline phosphatase family protein [Arthrobacter sp. 35W]
MSQLEPDPKDIMRSSHRTLRPLAATAALAAAAFVLAPAAPALAVGTPDYAGLPAGTKTQKTLVIGLDGATFSTFAGATMPNLAALRAGGLTAASNLYANPMAPTVSGAGWSTIATGAWPDKHKAVDNSFAGNNLSEYRDYQTRLETADPATSTLVVGTWGPIPGIVFNGTADLKIPGGDDANTTDVAKDYLANGNPDSTFVHLDEVDGAGHSFGSASQKYRDALAVVDAQVGELIAAVTSRPTYSAEDWLVMVTADHGHTPTGGHGGNTPLERETFVIAKGAGFTPGSTRNDVKIVDIAPTVLKHQGVAVDPAWKLDGTPISDLAADDFDSLRGSLAARADETAVAAGVAGWTHSTPAGWSIDNSAMPTGGVTEWRGWSFATDEFWTNVDRNQGRETSVRNRNVFAVADSDEWDDKTHAAGKFDSTLVSPEYPLNGQPTATVSFATNYVIDGPQTGDVYVSFDGAEPVSVKSYRSNTNRFEQLAVDVPAGATKAQLRFKYTGTNSAFWTVDQVGLSQEPAVAPTTTATIEAAPASGWYSQAPVVTLSTGGAALAALAADGSTTEYQLGAGAWTPYTGPVTMPEGSTEFNFRSTSIANVVEDAKTLGTIKVDTTAPAVTASESARTAVAAAEETGSGLAGVESSVDGGATWQPYTAPLTAGGGALTVQFRATDVAGNASDGTASVAIAALGSTDTPTTAPAGSAGAGTGTTAGTTSGDAGSLAFTGTPAGLAWIGAAAAALLAAGTTLLVRRRRTS